jgi:O-acetyl-ADP-ribose deacetylase (regulator of RNase III)
MASKIAPTGMACEPVERKIGNSTIKLQHGDLTALPVNAFVFYAREDLDLGSGYGTAIQGRGGAAIKKELDDIGSVSMGEAVITGAGGLNAKHIIHACGPKFQEMGLEGKLRKCVYSSLKLADASGLKSLAFPPMGCGFYGVPLDLSAAVMLDCFKSFLGSGSIIEEVIICVIDYRDYVPFKNVMETL